MTSLRVLLIEDEIFVAMMIEDMLADLGHEVVGPALHYDDGLALARDVEERVDFAVLDVNLRGCRSFPIAEHLERRGIPYFFATGYDALDDADLVGASRILKKPFSREELAAAISTAVAVA